MSDSHYFHATRNSLRASIQANLMIHYPIHGRVVMFQSTDPFFKSHPAFNAIPFEDDKACSPIKSAPVFYALKI